MRRCDLLVLFKLCSHLLSYHPRSESLRFLLSSPLPPPHNQPRQPTIMADDRVSWAQQPAQKKKKSPAKAPKDNNRRFARGYDHDKPRNQNARYYPDIRRDPENIPLRSKRNPFNVPTEEYQNTYGAIPKKAVNSVDPIGTGHTYTGNHSVSVHHSLHHTTSSPKGKHTSPPSLSLLDSCNRIPCPCGCVVPP